MAVAVCWGAVNTAGAVWRGAAAQARREAQARQTAAWGQLSDLLPKMPKKKEPPRAEEIAEMLGVAAEKTFKVEQDHIPKVRPFPSRPTAPLLRRLRRASCRPGAPLRCQLQG